MLMISPKEGLRVLLTTEERQYMINILVPILGCHHRTIDAYGDTGLYKRYCLEVAKEDSQ